MLLPWCTGCSVGYVWKQARGQYHIVSERRPIEKVLEDPSVSEATREKIRRVQEIKRFGEETLGMEPTTNYSTYFDTGGQPVAWSVSACPKDRLEPKTWWFPILGSVPYLGYFDHADAVAQKEALEAEGLDVAFGAVSAYSTLGWLQDSILSTMLDEEDGDLANLILHEMAHGTAYFSGQGNLNESLATFIGDEGAVAFLADRVGETAPAVHDARAVLEDNRLFSDFLGQMLSDLRAFYASGITRQEKIAARTARFRDWQETFRQEWLPRMHAGSFAYFPDMTLNNAVLLSFGRYHSDQDLFAGVHRRLDGDLAAFLREVRAAARLSPRNPRGPLETFQAGGPRPSELLEGPAKTPQRRATPDRRRGSRSL